MRADAPHTTVAIRPNPTVSQRRRHFRDKTSPRPPRGVTSVGGSESNRVQRTSAFAVDLAFAASVDFRRDVCTEPGGFLARKCVRPARKGHAVPKGLARHAWSCVGCWHQAHAVKPPGGRVRPAQRREYSRADRSSGERTHSAAADTQEGALGVLTAGTRGTHGGYSGVLRHARAMGGCCDFGSSVGRRGEL